jgi:hypothetical protein
MRGAESEPQKVDRHRKPFAASFIIIRQAGVNLAMRSVCRIPTSPGFPLRFDPSASATFRSHPQHVSSQQLRS